MGNKKHLTRRNFLKSALLVGAGLSLTQKAGSFARVLEPLAEGTPTLTPQLYLPVVLKNYSGEPFPTNTPSPTNHKVIHLHSNDATFWDFGSNYYGNYVNQSAVNNMVDRGVMELTGASTAADAWRALLPNYQNGQKIAIKVNLNNAFQCNDNDNVIDALIHPVNSVVRGLKMIGVAEEDVWVYDAIRYIPDRFVNGCLYPGVKFFGNCRQKAGFSSDAPGAYVTFNPPPSVPPPSQGKVTDVLINATYLIDMPIMKRHDAPGVSLSFKNHLGTINNPSDLHNYIFIDGSYYRSDYNPLVDLYKNIHIVNKTILILGDGLFGGRLGYNYPPTPWTTFGNQAPNSLFFATDPVAIDCVMCDFLHAELPVPSEADNYMRLAAESGLGKYERGNPWQLPWGSGYTKIKYVRIEL